MSAAASQAHLAAAAAAQRLATAHAQAAGQHDANRLALAQQGNELALAGDAAGVHNAHNSTAKTSLSLSQQLADKESLVAGAQHEYQAAAGQAAQHSNAAAQANQLAALQREADQGALALKLEAAAGASGTPGASHAQLGLADTPQQQQLQTLAEQYHAQQAAAAARPDPLGVARAQTELLLANHRANQAINAASPTPSHLPPAASEALRQYDQQRLVANQQHALAQQAAAQHQQKPPGQPDVYQVVPPRTRRQNNQAGYGYSTGSG